MRASSESLDVVAIITIIIVIITVLSRRADCRTKGGFIPEISKLDTYYDKLFCKSP